MALIKDVRKPVHVFKVEVGLCFSRIAILHCLLFRCEKEDGSAAISYALSNVHGGWFRNIEEKKFKLWYWGGLKRRFAYFWETLKACSLKSDISKIIDVRFQASPAPIVANISYETFCPGCNKCRDSVSTTTAAAAPQWRWWHILTGAPRYSVDQKQRTVH